MVSFVPPPGEDASDVVAGFFYQVARRILRWIEPKADEVSELERGEALRRNTSIQKPQASQVSLPAKFGTAIGISSIMQL